MVAIALAQDIPSSKRKQVLEGLLTRVQQNRTTERIGPHARPPRPTTQAVASTPIVMKATRGLSVSVTGLSRKDALEKLLKVVTSNKR